MVTEVGQEEKFFVAGKRFVVGGDKLKVRFTISYDDVLYIKADILHQDDSLRGKGTLIEITADDEDKQFKICSQAFPELRKNKFFVRGTDTDLDNRCCIGFYKTPEERNTVLNTLCVLIDRLNQPPLVSSAVKTIDCGNGVTVVEVTGPELSVQFSYNVDDTYLEGIVTHQSKELCGIGLLASNDVYEIRSASSPEICNSGEIMYVRGYNRDADSARMGYKYGDLSKRDRALNNFISLITKINDKSIKLTL